MNLFESNYEAVKPLSFQLRPQSLDEIFGQENLLGKHGVLRKLIEKGTLTNSIFFGPPGCGKSSLGEIISHTMDCAFESLNATTASLQDIKEVVGKAKRNIEYYQKKTILFLDEIHRFNKLQQDALLSYCEDGTFVLIGATTENPYYSLNNALLSRVMVFEFKTLEKQAIQQILTRAQQKTGISLSPFLEDVMVEMAQGDSRVALNYLELYQNVKDSLSEEEIYQVFMERKHSFHKTQDKYDMISAMIKSMRGSDPDAAVYWLGCLLEGGEDPRYMARRIMIQACEDVGMANPEAMLVAGAAMQASERIGMPEIRIILAQAVIYLAISTKSNSAYLAIDQAMGEIKNGNRQEVPKNICHDNVGYLYPHDYPNHFVTQKYMEEKRKYYFPQENKYEKLIEEKLRKLWENKEG